MASAMISERGLRKKSIPEIVPPAEKPSSRKPSKRKSSSNTAHNGTKNSADKKSGSAQEQNNNTHGKKAKNQTGNPKIDLFATYQPWVIQTYGDLAKTKTITLKKYARILRTLRGEECNSSDSSKFRFWVKAKGFHLGQPHGYDAKPADGIVCRYSVLDAEGCARNADGSEIYSGSANDPALYIPTPPVKNSTIGANSLPVYRKVAIVENFFDIIYSVHVELEGRPGKHAGQKRTYRTITETYAFLPREAVTRFLMGCTECQRRPRSISPAPILPTPSPSPTLLPLTNVYPQLPSAPYLPPQCPEVKPYQIIEYTKNWESEIDASLHTKVKTYAELIPTKSTSLETPKDNTTETDSSIYNDDPSQTYIELKPPTNILYTEIKNTGENQLFTSTVKASTPIDNGFAMIRSSSPICERIIEEKPKAEPDIVDENEDIDVEHIKYDSPISRIEMTRITEDLDTPPSIQEEKFKKDFIQEIDNNITIEIEDDTSEIQETNEVVTEIYVEKNEIKSDLKRKPYNPLDVCNLTSKDPPKLRTHPKKRALNHLYDGGNRISSPESYARPWAPIFGGSLWGYSNTTADIDYSIPITTTYLKHMKSLGYGKRDPDYLKYDLKDNITPEPADLNEEDQYNGQDLMKDAERLKTMLLAWNYHSQQAQGRNGDVLSSDSLHASSTTGASTEGVAELWASYHNALGLGAPVAKRARTPQPPRDHRTQSPLDTGICSITSGAISESVANALDETSSSAGGARDDDDGNDDDDADSDDRGGDITHHHDPERLKAFNMFVRLFVDENLDRIVPISKQPKEKIQAIIDSCTRQFPEFAERARKRIRTYLKSCRRNKKVRGELPQGGSTASAASGGSASGSVWDAAVRPTPAHLTSVQAEHILAQACENENHNAKRMRLGLDPLSQPRPANSTNTTHNLAIDTSAAATSQAVANQFLSLYSSGGGGAGGVTESPGKEHEAGGVGGGVGAAGSANGQGKDVGNSRNGSKNVSPASSPAPIPLFRPAFPQTFGQPQSFGRQNISTSLTNSTASTLPVSSSAGLLTLGGGASAGGLLGVGASGSLLGGGAGLLGAGGGLLGGGGGLLGGVSPAAVAAYQGALVAAMAAGSHGAGAVGAFNALNVAMPLPLHNAPTDLSMKNQSSTNALGLNTSLISTMTTPLSSTANPLGLGLGQTFNTGNTGSTKPMLLSHKLSSAEISAVKQLITGYRESAAFLLRSADELEGLLHQQP